LPVCHHPGITVCRALAATVQEWLTGGRLRWSRDAVT